MSRFLVVALLSTILAVGLAAACAGEEVVREVPVEVVVEKEVVREVPVEKIVTQEVVKEVTVPGETVVVEKEVIKEVQVPGETVVVTQEVVKEVPVEVVVERQVEVVKTVEVPVETIKEVVKVVEVPTTLLPEFGEAPELAQLVAAGKLPPVAERVGEDPLVITGQEIGRYGGSLRRVFIGPSDTWNFGRMSKTGLLRWTQDGGTVVPGVAKAWESNDDASEWTFELRKGMKWSDGMPFTADDFIFQFDEVLNNDDLVPSKPAKLMAGGKLADLEVIDDFTVKFVFEVPNSLFANFCDRIGQAARGRGDHPLHPGPLYEAVPCEVRRPRRRRQDG